MSDISRTLKQNPRPDKRIRSKVVLSSPPPSFISERKDTKSELLEVDNFIE